MFHKFFKKDLKDILKDISKKRRKKKKKEEERRRLLFLLLNIVQYMRYLTIRKVIDGFLMNELKRLMSGERNE